MNNSISQLGFLCIFNLIGGIAIGTALRGVVRGKLSCNNFFFFVWGALFGGMPILYGIAEFQKGTSFVLPIQVAAFALPIIIVAFVSDEFFETLHSPNILSIVVGGTFLMIGCAIIATNIFEIKAIQEKLVAGGIFALSGGAVFLIGLVRILKS
jgi:hypothetical protein